MKGLVLSGGGKKGAYQIGALNRFIVEEGHDYDLLAGVSVGAINSAKLAEAPRGGLRRKLLELHEFWNEIGNDGVWKHWFGWYVASAFWKPSVYNSAPLRRRLGANLDVWKIASSDRLLRVVAVCWDDGKIKVATENDPLIVDWVYASASFPVFLTPVEIGGKMWTDGGVRNVTPLGVAIEAGCDDIDVIVCSNPELPDEWDSKDRTTLPYAMRAVDLMSSEIIRDDLRVCGLKNQIAKLGGKYKHVRVRLVWPSRPFKTNSLDFGQKEIQELIEMGYEDSAHPILL